MGKREKAKGKKQLSKQRPLPIAFCPLPVAKKMPPWRWGQKSHRFRALMVWVFD